MRLSLSLPDIVRICTDSEELAIAHIVSELEGNGSGFNYLDATKRIKAAYRGVHSLPILTQLLPSDVGKVGKKSNIDVVKAAAPRAFGRRTHVFDLGPRSFRYGEGRQASYRAPFFFTEDGVIKLFYLQPRKSAPLTQKQRSLYATIAKKYLLDDEFFSQAVDVEMLDVAERVKGEGRVLSVSSLSTIEMLSDDIIQGHLRVVLDALEFVEKQNLVTKKRRPLKDPELPMFF